MRIYIGYIRGEARLDRLTRGDLPHGEGGTTIVSAPGDARYLFAFCDCIRLTYRFWPFASNSNELCIVIHDSWKNDAVSR